MRSRSRVAIAEMMTKTAFPIGEFVSIFSVSETKLQLLAFIVSRPFNMFVVLRAKRENEYTTTHEASPVRTIAIMRSSAGRELFVPEMPSSANRSKSSILFRWQ